MWTEMDSPVGPLRIVVHGGAITAIEFSPYRPPAGRPLGERDDNDPLLRRAVEQLTAYFARDLKEFDLPLDPRGSVFQRRVWDELLNVGYGETATYGVDVKQRDAEVDVMQVQRVRLLRDVEKLA